jgi:hypothetical protein
VGVELGIQHQWEEYRVRVFWNMVLRKMSVPNRADTSEDWRKLYNEELHHLYCSPNIIQVIKSQWTKCLKPRLPEDKATVPTT